MIYTMGLLLRTKMIPSMIDGMPVGNFIEWHPLMLISEESGLHTKKWQNVNVNATAEYRVPFVKGLKLKVQYNRTLDNRLIKKVNFRMKCTISRLPEQTIIILTQAM